MTTVCAVASGAPGMQLTHEQVVHLRGKIAIIIIILIITVIIAIIIVIL